MGRSPYKVNKEIGLDILQMYKRGESVYAIANMFGLTRQYVYTTLKKEGIKNPTFKMPIAKRDLAKALKLYEKGATRKEIARMLNVSGPHVYAVLRKAGVENPSFSWLTDTVKETLSEDYSKGMSLEGLSDKYGKSTPAIRGALKKLGIYKKSYKSWKNEAVDANEIRSLRSEGYSPYAMAYMLRMPPHVIRRILREQSETLQTTKAEK